MSGEALLEIRGLSKHYSAVKAVSAFDVRMESGKIYGLIGTNGAGKTTVINMISGLEKPNSGSILFEGSEISGQAPETIARRGIARTFQNLRLFSTMTVLDNVLVAAQIDRTYSIFSAVIKSPKYRREDMVETTWAMKLLEMLELSQYGAAVSSSLPYGHQRRLEIARALATRPKLLLLDEPAAGMNPQESADLMTIIRRIRDELSITILLIEHDMKVVMGVCEYIYAMTFGEIIDQGAPEDIVKSQKVIEAYLGGASKRANAQ